MACCGAGRARSKGREAVKCYDCRSWEEELYWKRFQPLHFCQILGSDVDFHKELVIPRKFADNARAILPPKVTLRGPSGASWSAIMTTRGDDLFLSDEWEEFVKAYSLQAGNILIFKYDGVSVFDVLIFDGENLCEKESAYFVKKCGHADSFIRSQRKRVSSEADVEENGDEHIHKAIKQAREEVSKKSRREKLIPYKAASSKANPRKSIPVTASENLNSFAILAELGKSIVQNATSVLEQENNAEMNGRCATEAPNQNNAPQFNGFSAEAPPEDATLINENWIIESPPQDTPQIDGICPSEDTPHNAASSKGRRKKKLGSPGKQQASVPNEKIQSKASRKKATSSIDGLKSKLGATKAAEGIPFGIADSSNRKYVSEAGKMALEMAHKEMSESSFVVVMRPTSVYRRFLVTVPPAWYKRHLAPKSQDVFLRLGDKTWLTRLSYSPCKATGQICGGWKQFVQENQLEEFDVCLFNLASQKDDTVMLDVTIFRAGPAEAIPLTQVMLAPFNDIIG